MNCTILCTGPSVEDYSPSGDEVVISCHFPMSEDTTHLCEAGGRGYPWQPIPTIRMISRRAHSYSTLMKYPTSVEWKYDGDRTDWVQNLVVDGLSVYAPFTYNRNLCTGEVAALWAVHSCKGKIQIWGMDSMWMNYSSVTNVSENLEFRAISRISKLWILKHPRVEVMRDKKPYKPD
jgi:hypothetical protein